MGYTGNIIGRATAVLERQRAQQKTNRDRLEQEIYQRQPRVAEIDLQLRRSISGGMRAAFRGGYDPYATLQGLRAQNLAMQEERAELLTAMGYPADVLDEKPLCGKCNDSGWRGSEMCDCLKVLCAQEQIAELSSMLNFGEQSFEQMDFSYYAEEVRAPWNRSPRANMEKIATICRDYARNFGRYYVDNLLLSGTTGLGKTFLSASIARVVSENGFSVVYDTAGNIFAQFEVVKFGRDEEELRQARSGTRRYLGCDLLILDDLGSEMTTPFVQSALYQLINTRLVEGKRTVISSNLTMDDIRHRYTPQIASRLEGEYRVLPFFGDDIRIVRKGRG